MEDNILVFSIPGYKSTHIESQWEKNTPLFDDEIISLAQFTMKENSFTSSVW